MGQNKIIAGLLVMLVFSCKKDKQDPVDFNYDYAPQTVGHYCVYDVVEIFHDDVVGIHDTTTYKLKEKIESTFLDNEGRTSLRLERSILDTLGNWNIKDVWYSTRTTTRYEKVEEDERFIRLAFPVKEEAQWNGNAFNLLDEWTYEYTDVDVPRLYSGLNFPYTARVLHVDEFNYVQRHISYEVYAKHVGLVSKYYKVLTIDGFDSTNAIKGREIYMNILSYGVE